MNIKGLLLKELYTFWGYSRIYILLAAIFFIATLGSGNLFMSLIAMFIFAMLVPSLMAIDEKTGWERYSACLPYRRRDVVTAKYIAMAVIALVMTAFFCLAYSIHGLVLGEPPVLEAIIIYLALNFMIFAVYSFVLPLTIKFGHENGRVFFLLMSIVDGAAIAVLAQPLYSDQAIEKTVAETARKLQPLSAGMILLGALAICAVLFLISWVLSVRQYEKKEF